MEAKKSAKADLENKKGLFIEIGLVVILAASLVAFNMKSYDMSELDIQQRVAVDELEDIIIQTQEETPPPPPEPEVPEVTTELVIVENDAEIENELGVLDVGDDANKEQETFVPVQIEEEQEVEEEEIFAVVEEVPTFVGGEDALYKFLGESIKYPAAALDNGIEGRVYVRFVVEKDGSVSNVRVLRDIGGGCGAEAMRVVKSMPKWKPGKQQGRAVRAEFNLPVNFTLQ